MKKILLVGFLIFSCIALGIAYKVNYFNWSFFSPPSQPVLKLERIERKAAREEYFFWMLRDPSTNAIPGNVRNRELAFSKSLPDRKNLPLKFKGEISSSLDTPVSIDWKSIGPVDVGGRTRALGIDRRNSNTIIAGGVTGGIWKSVDGGNTWDLKTERNQYTGVTALAQNPLDPDVWYYGAGEFVWSATGTGIFKSVDNGETWTRLPTTRDEDEYWSSPYDYVSRIAISPTTGSVFLASNGFGISKSEDGNTFNLVLGENYHHTHAEVAVNTNGAIAAVLSSGSSDINANPGVFISEDDGSTWTEVTPSTFPQNYSRSVLAFAPSAPEMLYIMTLTHEGIKFHLLNISTGLSEDRSANLTDIDLNTWGTWCMVLAIKPDNPNHVFMGGVFLYHSSNGFSTSVSKDDFVNNYITPDHVDQHIITFDPFNPNKMWAGHDGGISVADNVTASQISWRSRDLGYITSQFYTIALPKKADDNRIMGGTQDNGTPFLRLDSQKNQAIPTLDISGGDGSFGHFTSEYIYVSTQNGYIMRLGANTNGDRDGRWSLIQPEAATNKLFIHPYVIDPNDEGVMYYPGGDYLWRHTSVNSIPNYLGNGTGWTSFKAIQETGFTITALKANRVPANILYFGGSNYNNNVPKIYRLDNASTSTEPIDISIPTITPGSHLRDIVVNPINGYEAIAIFSNYSITGIYRTTNGGTTWKAIEGNLTGNSQNLGPSIQAAAIIPTQAGTIYLVGTSIGVYSTTEIEGDNTIWVQEGSDTIGYAVSVFLETRLEDGTIALGSHGSGIFLGALNGATITPEDSLAPAVPRNLMAGSNISGVELKWIKNIEGDINHYRIYRGSSPQNLSHYASVSFDETSFTDPDASFSTRFYGITAVDFKNQESAFSDLVSIYRTNTAINNSWKLVSSPLVESSDVTLPTNSQLFSFSGAYKIASELQSGSGYWIKADGTGSISYDGEAHISHSLSLKRGWNLVGGPSTTVGTADIADPGNILGATPVFAYHNGGYQTANQLIPTEGYWMYANAEGEIELSLDNGKPKGNTRSIPEVKPMDELLFTRNNLFQKILVASQSLSEVELQQYILPPLAPDPVLDVRTARQTSVSDQKRTELLLTSQTYPVQVMLQPREGESRSYRLEGINKSSTIYWELHPGKSVLITEPFDKLYLASTSEATLPLENQLLPNYPNPFNPTTTIRYQVAASSLVRLEVYNIMGQKVQTLVDREQLPGQYSMAFNGASLASGTYFLRIRIGEFSQVQKMMLIK